MKLISLIGRIFLGIAYALYGYMHFAHTAADANMVPNGIGSKTFWVIFIGVCWWATAISFFTNILTRLSGLLASLVLLFILVFTVLPHFDGVSSWLSMATIIGLIGGSLGVAAYGNLCPLCKKQERKA